jgi:hypothetical protein
MLLIIIKSYLTFCFYANYVLRRFYFYLFLIFLAFLKKFTRTLAKEFLLVIKIIKINYNYDYFFTSTILIGF